MLLGTFLPSFVQVIGPPPPVATGPGLDRPLFKLGGEQMGNPAASSEAAAAAALPSYTMARTRRFYQDQMMGSAGGGGAGVEPRLLHFSSADSPPQSRTFLDSPRRMESLDSSLGSTGRTYG